MTDFSRVPHLLIHEDPDLFREAVTFTASETHFLPRLIEKDYWCSLLLEFLQAGDGSLVFKGGTCLAKVHSEFCRLSEDLDFTIPTPFSASRTERRRLSQVIKRVTMELPKKLKTFRLVEPFTGANNSAQYVATLGYTSVITRNPETIKIEVGLREPLMTEAWKGMARTILLDPVSGRPMLPLLPVLCLTRSEAMAEKVRAALSRPEPAIRDFFDIDYAIQKLHLKLRDPEFIELLKHKLAVPGTGPVDVSLDRLTALIRQLDSQLKPVLRATDLAGFNLERAFTAVATLIKDA